MAADRHQHFKGDREKLVRRSACDGNRDFERIAVHAIFANAAETYMRGKFHSGRDRDKREPRREERRPQRPTSSLYGVLPVLEALRSGGRRIEKIIVADGARQHRLNEIFELAREHRVIVEKQHAALGHPADFRYPRIQVLSSIFWSFRTIFAAGLCANRGICTVVWSSRTSLLRTSAP